MPPKIRAAEPSPPAVPARWVLMVRPIEQPERHQPEDDRGHVPDRGPVEGAVHAATPPDAAPASVPVKVSSGPSSTQVRSDSTVNSSICMPTFSVSTSATTSR